MRSGRIWRESPDGQGRDRTTLANEHRAVSRRGARRSGVRNDRRATRPLGIGELAGWSSVGGDPLRDCRSNHGSVRVRGSLRCVCPPGRHVRSKRGIGFTSSSAAERPIETRPPTLYTPPLRRRVRPAAPVREPRAFRGLILPAAGRRGAEVAAAALERRVDRASWDRSDRPACGSPAGGPTRPSEWSGGRAYEWRPQWTAHRRRTRSRL